MGLFCKKCGNKVTEGKLWKFRNIETNESYVVCSMCMGGRKLNKGVKANSRNNRGKEKTESGEKFTFRPPLVKGKKLPLYPGVGRSYSDRPHGFHSPGYYYGQPKSMPEWYLRSKRKKSKKKSKENSAKIEDSMESFW